MSHLVYTVHTHIHQSLYTIAMQINYIIIQLDMRITRLLLNNIIISQLLSLTNLINNDHIYHK